MRLERNNRPVGYDKVCMLDIEIDIGGWSSIEGIRVRGQMYKGG